MVKRKAQKIMAALLSPFLLLATAISLLIITSPFLGLAAIIYYTMFRAWQ